jgi:uracil-DNA glycosylase family 4
MTLIPLSQLTRKHPPMLGPLCGKCGLLDGCNSPKMPPSGKGHRRILIVGEAPGRDEDRDGRQFVGESGQLLRDLLYKCGVTMREDCWIINALSCRPPRNEIQDPKQVEFCRPLVIDAIKKFDPNVIIPLGKYAVKSVIGHLWKEDTKGIMRWAGFQIPNHEPNCWICPTVHPAFVLRQKDRRKGEYKDRGLAERWMLRHLKAAVELSSKKPWDEPPDYLSQVQVINDPKDAAGVLQRLSKGDKPLAFDYETTALKPQHRLASIVCASVSDGETTIAFPWLGEAIDAMKALLASRVPKIAHNQKFEMNWTACKLGIVTNNFAWDTMVQAHVLDGRPGIAGLKFQSYVTLGQPDYDSFLKPYLSSRQKGGNEPNRVKQLDRKDLMTYCGLDSLLTWLLAQEQLKVFKIKLT